MNIPDKFIFGLTSTEYRPCYIMTPHRTSSPTRERALFHKWTYEQQPVSAGLARGSHPGGQLSETWGIVEKEDGSVCLVSPQCIVFTDTREMMSQIAWDDEKEEAKT